MSSDRAARNATCCEHAASDHDLFGCAVDVSTDRRAYERCHLLVPAAIDHDAAFCCGAGEGFVQAAYDLIVDHPMWIDGNGGGLDYSPEREARIGDFLHALLPLVRAYGDAREARRQEGSR